MRFVTIALGLFAAACGSDSIGHGGDMEVTWRLSGISNETLAESRS